MFTLTEIKKEIKNNPICLIYHIKSKKYKIVVKADKKSEAKNELIKLINKKKIKNDGYFLLLKLTFHTGTSFGQGGVLSAVLSAYGIENGILKNVNNIDNKDFWQVGLNMVGPVWFKKKWLEDFGWSYKYLDNIIEKLIMGKAKINKIGATIYNVEFR